jgi:putative membrane protein
VRLSILSYDVIKSLHLIAVISWMVGLLYLPRLFVYHNESMQKSDLDKTFLIMEYRLYHYIMNPALILTSLFGLYLLNQSQYLLSENYFLLKSILVFLLILFHVYLYFLYKDFKKGYRIKTTKFYRIINEIPTVLMVIVIFLIFLKPDLQI